MRTSFISFYQIFTWFRLAAAFCTAIAFFLVQIAPPKEQVLHPSPYTSVNAYADNVEPSGNSAVYWQDKKNYTFECDIKEGVPWRYCGVSMKFYDKPLTDTIITQNEDYAYGLLQSHDLTGFNYLLFDLSYEGSENYIRVYMRDAFNMPKEFSEHNQQKFLNEIISKEEMGKAVKITLGEFSVADWWVAQFQKPRQDGVATFDKIFEVGVDFSGQPSLGRHKFSIRKVTLVGEYVNKETFYFSIIIFWLSLGVVEGLVQLIRLMRRHQSMSSENTSLREEARTDALTGLANRHGIQPYIQEYFPVGMGKELYLIIMDLDHFKRVNDTFGHDVGDCVLVGAAKTFKKVMRENDVVGRWGGEEFLVLCETSEQDLKKIIVRLREELNNTVVKTSRGDVLVTMSMGITRVHADESFEVAFKRADKAVYEAKLAGRNTWRFI